MEVDATLLDNLREINRLTARLISLDVIVNEAFAAESSGGGEAAAVAVLSKLNLAPEYVASCDEKTLREHSGSPVLLKLKNGNWISFSCFHVHDNREFAVLFDPTAREADKIIQVPTPLFLERWGGISIFLRNFPNSGFSTDSRHTAYFCLCAIARNLGVNIDLAQILHDFAVSDDEPAWGEFRKVADKYRLKCRQVTVPFDRLDSLGNALPAIIRKKDGKFAVLCGCRQVGEEVQPSVWDPLEPKNSYNNIRACSPAEFQEVFSDRLILLKKIYSLGDPDQPFSLGWFVPEFLRQKVYFIQVIVAVFILSLIALVVPLFFQIVVDKVLVNESYNTLNVLGIGVICALAFSAVMEFFRDYLVIFATNKIDIRTAGRAFQHLLKLPIAFFEQLPAGVLIKHMQQLDKIRAFLSGSLFFSVLELFMLVIFIPFMWFYSAKLTMIVLLYSLLIASIIFVLIKPFQVRLHALYQAEGKRQSMLVESIGGVRTVKSLALEPVQNRKWNDVTAFAIRRYFDVSKISLTAKSVSRFLEQLLAVNIIWVGALDVFDHRMTVGALIAFQMLSGRVTGPIVKLIGLLHEYQQTALSVKMLGQIMNHPVESVGGEIRPRLDGSIEFEHVNFRYAPEAELVIRDLSLCIPAGGVVGIVGRSGSGKTTLTKLLQGLYPLQSGIIKLSGVDLREISSAFLRSQIGIVLQDNFFFSGTIRENLLMTKPGASMDELLIAVRLAGIEEFIQKQPKGFDTSLEENATNLSGGQRQRLAIARALLPNPQILIFDEATSALDPESEEIVRSNLRRISYGRTVVIVSHRLSMVTGADFIVVLDNGEIRDKGKHEELLGRPGIYRDFWTRQQGGTA